MAGPNYLTIAPEEVVPGAVAFESLPAGEAIAEGEGYYLDAGTGKAKLAVNTSAAEAALRGVCVGGAAAANQRMVGQRTGSLVAGATAAVIVGTPYFVSGTPGKFCPIADVAPEAFVTLAAFGDADDSLALNITPSGIQVPGGD